MGPKIAPSMAISTATCRSHITATDPPASATPPLSHLHPTGSKWDDQRHIAAPQLQPQLHVSIQHLAAVATPTNQPTTHYAYMRRTIADRPQLNFRCYWTPPSKKLRRQVQGRHNCTSSYCQSIRTWKEEDNQH